MRSHIQSFVSAQADLHLDMVYLHSAQVNINSSFFEEYYFMSRNFKGMFSRCASKRADERAFTRSCICHYIRCFFR